MPAAELPETVAVETVDEAGPAPVGVAQEPQTLLEIDTLSGVSAGIAQVTKEGDSRVVGTGLLGGAVCFGLVPDDVRLGGECGQARGAGSQPVAFGVPVALGAAGVRRIQQPGGGPAR
ncbi:hypothetical protein [Streptomyces sp. H27-H5]|uniref:hypothetical protein n=1 Tax=Streptomyces sp. H27-H5 TaxID=2996460 RepID=UPI002270B101|nr:hypothetical protein [Streptomyces sp. H27-H5]MCY0960155.1 hypothetical protein [Streptomyces sp. H27-H5]